MIGTICKNCGRVSETINGDLLCDECVEKIEAYNEKKEAKIRHYEQMAKKAEQQSEEAYEASNRAVAGIPFGQPILVGHHSERTHRNALKRCHNAMDKSIELKNKAEYYEQKANSAESSNAISSDDPEAVCKIKDKIEALEQKRKKIKELKKQGEQFPHYTLPYISQEIRRLKQRIEHLRKVQEIEETEEEINGIKIHVDKDANRVKMFFDGKPEEEVRNKLKRNGFRWSPYNGCWQAYLKKWNIDTAKEIAEEGV